MVVGCLFFRKHLTMKLNKTRELSGFTLFFLTLNPIFPAIGIKGVYILAINIITSIKYIAVTRKHIYLYLLLALLLLTASFSSNHNNTLTPLIFVFFFSTTLFFLAQFKYDVAVRFIESATKLFTIFIVLSIIGVFYALMGGQPLFHLLNPDGRENNFYLTTFSNATTFTIRPSAIYDEPGAFSFYICMLIALRSIIGLDDKKSIMLLLGGFITQSITHLGFSLIWVTWFFFIKKNKKPSIKHFTYILSLLIMLFLIYQSGIMEWAIERIIDFYENPWKNPRQRAYDEALNAISLNFSNIFFGFDVECAKRSDACLAYGENPLTPLAYGGLSVSWPYYVFIAASFLSIFFSRNGLLYVGISFLLLQRPYALEFPYSALFALLFIITFLKPVKKL